MWRYFLGVSKTDNKRVVKETPQKADARNYEKTRSLKKKRRTRRELSSLKRMMTVLEMTTRVVSDYESDAEMPKK